MPVIYLLVPAAQSGTQGNGVCVCLCPSVRLCVSPGWKHVNMVTCEIIDIVSANLVCGSLLSRSWISLYMGHLDLLSRSPSAGESFYTHVIKFLVNEVFGINMGLNSFRKTALWRAMYIV